MKRLCIIVLLLIAVVWVWPDYGPAFAILRAREAMERIHATTRYEADTPDRIKAPDETRGKAGDCADMSAVLVEDLARMGYRSEMSLLDLRDYEQHHAVVSMYGWTFDPVAGEAYRGAYTLPHVVNDGLEYGILLQLWPRARRRQRDVWFTE